MADVEVVVNEPHIRLHADTAGLESGKQRNGAPVIIVGVASGRDDISRDVCRPMQYVHGGSSIAVTPPLGCAVDFIGEEGNDNAAGDGNKLDNAPEAGGERTDTQLEGEGLTHSMTRSPKSG